MEQPLVTIYGLIYRKFDGFERALDSVIQQTYPNLELILADDGSDGFEEFEPKLRAYLEEHAKDRFCRVEILHHKQNQGTVKNANSAIKLAQGTYIKGFTFEDYFVGNRVIEECVNFCQQHPCDLLIGQTWAIGHREQNEPPKKTSLLYRVTARGGRKSILQPSTTDIRKLQKMSPEELRETLSTKCVISTPSVFFTRKMFEQVGWYDENYRLLEDTPLWPKCAKMGLTFGISDIRMLFYELNGMSNSGDLNPAFRVEFERSLKNDYAANMKDPKQKELFSRYAHYFAMDTKDRQAQAGEYSDVKKYIHRQQLRYLLFDTRL